jgi:hypothetical protein
MAPFTLTLVSPRATFLAANYTARAKRDERKSQRHESAHDIADWKKTQNLYCNISYICFNFNWQFAFRLTTTLAIR